MLSSRGSMPTATLLAEVVEAQPPSLGKRVLLHSDAQKVWISLCRVLRHQLLQANNIILPHKTMGFFFKKKEVVRDGETKYWARTCHLGFHDAFVTRFSLDAARVPRLEGAREDFVKLPIDYVANECGFSVEYVTTFLNEVFLTIGEALFRGRLLQLDFEGVANLLVKKEKAAWTYEAQFRSDVYAIDSRKWPIAVKEVGLRMLTTAPRPDSASSSLRPSSARSNNSSRPSSAQPRPRSSSSARPTTQTAAASEALSKRGAFVSAATTGKTFEDILRLKNKPAPKQRPQSNRRPLRVVQQQEAQENEHSRDVEPQSCHANNFGAGGSTGIPTPRVLGQLDENEEESIYSVLSPSRHQDPMASNAMLPVEAAQSQYNQQKQGDNSQFYQSSNVGLQDQDFRGEESIYNLPSQQQWQTQTIKRPLNMDPRQLGITSTPRSSGGGRPGGSHQSFASGMMQEGSSARVPTPLVAVTAADLDRPSSTASSGGGCNNHYGGWEGDFAGEDDHDVSKHVHFSSPTVPAQVTPLAFAPQDGPAFGIKSFGGYGQLDRPVSARKRFQNPSANMAQVKSLLQGAQ